MNDLYLLSATEAARKVKAGEISVLEWVQSCAERIEKLESTIKAWAYFDTEKAFSQAREIDRRLGKGERIGSLCGALVGVKDIFNTRDMPTCMGSPIWEGFTPGNDARVVFYLRQADAVIPGKTVTAEFAVHAHGETVNPHNFRYSPGTSSSGSAAAVASLMVPLAIGTQTAGSIIRPASYCGVYGFKPSFGLIPRTGTLKTTDSLDTVGMFARSVGDLELLFDTIRVHGDNFPISRTFLDDPARQTKGCRSWRVALVTSSIWVWRYAEKYAREALLRFASDLSGNDLVVEEVKMPSDFSRAHEIHGAIYDKTLAYYFKEEFKKRALISEVLYEIINRGNQITLDQYKLALDRQNRLAKRLECFLEDNGYDILLTLSTSGVAPMRDGNDRPDSSLIWTLCGVPAINVPVFRSFQNLPFGIQIVGRRYHDILLLNFARFLEGTGFVTQDAVPASCQKAMVDGQAPI
ncbi:MAG: amidase [Candidatus Binatia bacterium]